MRLFDFAIIAFVASAALGAGTPPAPAANALPDGPGKAQVVAACAACHEIGVVTAKHYGAEKWGQVLDIMVDRGAKVSDADYDLMVTYLAKNFGPVQK